MNELAVTKQITQYTKMMKTLLSGLTWLANDRR